MQARGIDNFSLGETCLPRVALGGGPAMARLSGWIIKDGALLPENVCRRLNATDGIGKVLPCPEQAPVCFDGQLVARDGNGYLRVFDGAEWGTPLRVPLDVPAESRPCRLDNRLVFPTRNKGLMVWEPASRSTKLRPLSMKAPGDYEADEAPTITRSTAPGVQLFDCEDANVWTAAGTGTSVDNTGTDEALLTMDNTTPVSQKSFTKSLGSTGIALTSKKYLVLDLALDRNQATPTTKVTGFVNDDELPVSGLELRLYSDTACTTLLKTLAIPELVTGGRVNRIAWHLGTLAATCKGLAVCTDANFVPPSSASITYTLHAYSADFDDDWEHLGNFLMPAVAWTPSPWADDLPPDGSAGSSAVVLQTFTTEFDDITPAMPLVQWCYAFAGRDRLGDPQYSLLLSNPSEDSTDIVADPWRTYTVAVTLPTDGADSAMTDYGDYLSAIAIYRQIYDGTSGLWSDYDFLTTETLDDTMSHRDTGEADDNTLDSMELPEVVELTHDYASTARYCVASQGRVVAAGLNWSENIGGWRQPTDIQISGLDQESFTTTVDEESKSSDGVEVGGYAGAGADLRGMETQDRDVYLWTDREEFVLRGDSPLTGYRASLIGMFGCRSARSVANCEGRRFWHDGETFRAGFAGETAADVGRGRVDSTLIDWTAPHGACYHRGEYCFFCTLDGEQVLLRLDVRTGALRTRASEALDLVGIASDGAILYGLTSGGDVLDLAGSEDDDYGAGETIREAKTAPWILATALQDAAVPKLLIEAATDQNGGLDLLVEAEAWGLHHAHQEQTVTITPAATAYPVQFDLVGNVVRYRVRYIGTTPPTIYSLGLAHEEAPAR